MLYDAIFAANQAGHLFVCSAGNSFDIPYSIDGRYPHYPASFDLPNIISVMASDNKDKPAKFSNNGIKNVDIAAPGQDIISTVPNGNCTYCDQSGYSFGSGSSASCTMVAGAASLLSPLFPDLTHLQVKEKITLCSEPLSGFIDICSFGGRLNLYNLFEADITPPAPTDLQLYDGDSISFDAIHLTVTNTGDDGMIGQAYRVIIGIFEDRQKQNHERFSDANSVLVRISGEPGVKEYFWLKNLSPSTHYFIYGWISDNAGNLSLSSKPLEVYTDPVETVFFDDMEGNTEESPMWSVGGDGGNGVPALWHKTHKRFESPWTSFGYMLERNQTYFTGQYRNWGYLESPTINLTKVKHARLTFFNFIELNRYLVPDPSIFGEDDVRLEVSTDGGESWTTIFKFEESYNPWHKDTVELWHYSGYKIKLRYYINPSHNPDFRTTVPGFGWYIDNFKLIGTPI